jgi:hypothetical protein
LYEYVLEQLDEMDTATPINDEVLQSSVSCKLEHTHGLSQNNSVSATVANGNPPGHVVASEEIVDLDFGDNDSDGEIK